eukprot:TRINITY_DN11110_c0_g1_i1.p1 TRINITY_DN11110_c0_g1~~TRINITY_DN11110_c0_g1_i1.p1  ORF type:complete len:793 (+),score=108.52 TRINITY_DN11110_c0_g1_i1:51-2429(+)
MAAMTALVASAAWFSLGSNHISSSGCRLFRHEFSLASTPSSAVAAFTAAGYGEIWINGEKADASAVLEPAWTQYDQRLLVAQYDVTGKLKAGQNVVGLMLGAGWYGHLSAANPNNDPVIKMALEMKVGDQNLSQTVTSGPGWTTGPCPITYNDVYNGEHYDARLENPAWSMVNFPPRWQPAPIVPTPLVLTNTKLTEQTMNPIRALSLLPSQLVYQNMSDGRMILDFAQNIAGWLRLELPDCAFGTTITLRHAEFLTEPRTQMYRGNLRGAKATDVYTCKGGKVVYEPRFTYHGFRFAEITVEGAASLSWSNIQARVVHSDVKPRGLVQFANRVLNDVQLAIRWTQVDNLHSVPTDCPQRDERQGWMADASVSSEQAALNFDMCSFYTNWLQVIADAQQSTLAGCTNPLKKSHFSCKGAVPDTTPHMPGVYGSRPADPSWGAALPIVFDVVRRYCGEAQAKPFVEPVHSWADFLLTMEEGDGSVHYHYYGDWLQPGKVPSDEKVSQMTSGFNALRAVKIASSAGPADRRTYFEQEFTIMLEAWEKSYWDESAGYFLDGSQAPQVYALYLGVSPAREKLAIARLVKLLKADGIGTGIISTKYLFPVLSKHGHVDLGLKLASSTSFPSWGFMLSKGATTIWEHWDAYHNPSGDTMSSHNHPAFTSVGAWFYTDLVGMRVDRSPVELGTMLDEFDPLLPQAFGELNSSEGQIQIDWVMNEGGGTNVHGVCPFECIVRVPLNGLPLSSALDQLSKAGHSGAACGKAVCMRTGTGNFHFELSKPSKADVAPDIAILT